MSSEQTSVTAGPERTVICVAVGSELVGVFAHACAECNVKLQAYDRAIEAMQACQTTSPAVIVAVLPFADALWSDFYEAVRALSPLSRFILLLPEVTDDNWMSEHELDLHKLPVQVFAWLPTTSPEEAIVDAIMRACGGEAKPVPAKHTVSPRQDGCPGICPVCGKQCGREDGIPAHGPSYAELAERCEALERSSRLMSDNVLRVGNLAIVGMQLADTCQQLSDQVNSVLGLTELLKDGELRVDADGDTIVDTIFNKAWESSNLLHRIMSSASQALVGGTFETVECNVLLEEVVCNRRHVQEINGIENSVWVARRPLYLQCDEHRLKLLLFNLLTNAEQSIVEKANILKQQRFSDENLDEVFAAHDYKGRISISVDAGPNNMIRFSVSDNGHGASPDVVGTRHKLGCMFDPFYTTRADYGQAGLGLAICKAVATAHDGEIYAESLGSGQGVRVIFELPATSTKLSFEQKESVSSVSEAIGQGRRLLVVEDDPLGAKLSRQYLERFGYCVDVAPNGQVGLELVAKEKYDAVITDYRMPEMDGQMFYRALAHTCPRLREKVVFVTGFALDLNTREFVQSTGCPYLVKPVSCWELLRSVKECLES